MRRRNESAQVMSASVQLERLIKVFETLRIPRVLQTAAAAGGVGSSSAVASAAAMAGETAEIVASAVAGTGSPILATLVSAGRGRKDAAPVGRSEKLQSCSQFCECLLSPTLQNNPDFPKYLSLSIEALMDLCDDADHDVRIAADEAVNKLIKSLPSSYMNHLLFEFYKELKRRGAAGVGGPTRSLSLSLRKFAALCSHIKTSRRRSYVTNLLPCLAELAREREEEVLLEALREALPRLCAHLLRYATDAEVKLFLKAFLPNLHSETIVVRRTAAQLIAVVSQHARCPFAVLASTLQLLIDMVAPVNEERPLATIHGVLVALRHTAASHHALTASGCRDEAELGCRAEQWASVLELCLFYAQAKDGTIVTAALEALHQLLRCPPAVLLPQLLHPNGAFWRTSIYRSCSSGVGPSLSRTGSVSLGSLSRLPTSESGVVATPESERHQLIEEALSGAASAPAVDDASASLLSDCVPSSLATEPESSDEGPSTGTTESANSPVSAGPDDIDEEEDDDVPIEIPSLAKKKSTEEEEMAEDEDTSTAAGIDLEDTTASSVSELNSRDRPASTKTLQEIPVRREGDLGQLCDPEHPPLLFCARLVAYRFLLTGNPGELLSDRLVRVSLKALALACLNQIARRAPHLLCSTVLKSADDNTSQECQPSQLLTDAFKYCRHEDPQLSGHGAALVAFFTESVFRNSFHAADYRSWLRTVWDWEGACQEPPSLDELLDHFSGHVLAQDCSCNVTLHRGLVALKTFAAPALASPGPAPRIMELLERCLHLARNKYRLVRTALLDLFASLDFTQTTFAEAHSPCNLVPLWRVEPLQQRVLRMVLDLSCEEDREVTRSAVDCLVHMVPKLYFPTCTASSSAGCITGMERRLLCLTLATRHCPRLLRSLMNPYLWGHNAPPAPLFGTAHVLDMSPWAALEGAERSGLAFGAAFETNLQRVLHLLSQRLAVAGNKNEVVGCVSALSGLAQAYPPCWHPAAWGVRNASRPLSGRECPFRRDPDENASPDSQDLFLLEHCVCLLTTSPYLTDQVFHQELLQLSGQLIAGYGLSHLIRTALDDEKRQILKQQPSNPQTGSQGAQLSPVLGGLLSALLRHVIRLLCVFTHVLEEQTPAPPPQTKLILPNPLGPNPLSSPVRSAANLAPNASTKKRGAHWPGKDIGNSASVPLIQQQPQQPQPPPPQQQQQQQSGDVATKDGMNLGDKKQDKDAAKEEKEGKGGKSRESIGQFHSMPHYMRLYDSVKAAYKSYKISFELNKSDRTVQLLETCLDHFCLFLELAGLAELTRSVEEVLQYLRSAYSLLPVATVRAMRQLLRALFGTNLISQWDADLCRIYEHLQTWLGNANPAAANDMGLTVMTHQLPYQQLSQVLQSSGLISANLANPTDSLYAWLRYSGERRQPLILRPASGLDKSTISGYIRLFEPLVILTLRDYTSTSSAALQAEILALLSQLIHLRVNYCQLDADQRFLQIVRRQCEQLEESHPHEANRLAPALFNFLILLSYEKSAAVVKVLPGQAGPIPNPNTMLVAMPELLQLADGLLASGLDPTSAVLPVLQQIVADQFVRRDGPNAGPPEELNTQREYLLSILLKLCQWPAALTPLRLVIEHAAGESEERWHRISKQVLDTLLPIMAAGQLRVDSAVDLDALHALLAALSPGVFRPLDELLQMIFAPPTAPTFNVRLNTSQEGVSLPRWSAVTLALIRTLLSHTNEEFILQRIGELNLSVQINKRSFASPLRHAISSCSASSTTPEWESQEAPETVLLRFFFQLLGLLVSRLAENAANFAPASADSAEALQSQEEAVFLSSQAVLLQFFVLHLFREASPSLPRLLSGARQLCASECARFYSVEDLNSLLFELRALQPFLAAQWCHLLTRLRHTDESWWRRILQSPSVSLRRGSHEVLLQEAPEAVGVEEEGGGTLNTEITRSLAMTFFSASVISDGTTDGEKLSWLIVRHVHEVVAAAASGDPVMQDLVSAVHRNSGASGLFLQALQLSRGGEARWKELHLTRAVLRCVEGIHLSASGRLLALLFERFLFAACLALAKRAEAIACRRVEMLLLVPRDCQGQLPLEEVDAMLARLPSGRVRFEHLRGLLSRLRLHLQPPSDPLCLPTDPSTPPEATTTGLELPTSREWYLERLRRHCCGKLRANPRLCARLLQHIDFTECSALMGRADFQAAILEQCFRISCVRTQGRFASGSARFSPVAPLTNAQTPGTPSEGQRAAGQVDKLFAATELALLQRLKRALAEGPPSVAVETAGEEAGARRKRTLSALCSGLVQYLVVLKQLPVPVPIPPEHHEDIVRFVGLYCQQCLPNAMAGERAASGPHLLDVLPFLRLLLALFYHPTLVERLGADPELCASLATSLHFLVFSGFPSSLSRASRCPFVEGPRQPGGHSRSVFRARWMLSEMMTRLVLPGRLRSGVGDDFNCLRGLFHRTIVALCRLPTFNSAVRGPNSSASSPAEEGINMASLVDRPLLEDFVMRMATLGWTSRKQFEEEWVALLYPLNPPGEGISAEEEEEPLMSPAELVERSQVALTSMWGLTRLLLDTLGQPEPGNPLISSSGWEHRARGKLPAFNHTRSGRRLSQVAAMLWEELEACLYGERGPLDTGCPRGWRRDWNLERQANPSHYGHEQLNLEVMRRRVQSGASATAGAESLPGLLDVHSCLAFVPDLFAPWLEGPASPPGTRRSALAVRTHAVRSAVALADLCSSTEQAEWLADALTTLATEEVSLIRPAVICGLAKVTAVLHSSNHAGGAPLETVAKLVESGLSLNALKPTLMSLQTASLHAAMYLLQMDAQNPPGQERDANTTSLMQDMHQHVVHFLERSLVVLANNREERDLYSESFWLTVLAASFFYCEQLSELLRETDLVANLITVCQQLTDCPLPIHVALFRGFERLLLTGSLPRLTVDVLVKLALDRLRGSELCPVRALPPLALFLACMYVTQQASPAHPAPNSEAAELRRLSALERTVVLYSRMQRSAPLESRLLSRVLPHVSLDFFSPEEVLNRTLRELVHPSPLYPDLAARLVFEAFRQLCQREQGGAVRKWTLLAVHNLAEMQPLERALSSLSVAFLSCTENVWLRGIFHCALSRLGCRVSSEDEECFLHASADFFRSLASADDKETFLSAFSALAPHEPTFQHLVTALKLL